MGSTTKNATGKVPEGHRRVRIGYSPNLDEIGTVVDRPADEAAVLVAEHRARYDDGTTPPAPAAEAAGK